MREIRFNLKPNLSKEQEMRYLETIALRITGEAIVLKKDSGYRWQLGRGNDWWMDKDPKTGEYILAYRYGVTKQEEMKATRTFLIWCLGLERFNKQVA